MTLKKLLQGFYQSAAETKKDGNAVLFIRRWLCYSMVAPEA